MNSKPIHLKPNNEQPLVGCVILNWNGWRDTVACLDALRAIKYSRMLIVVVDNGSTDDSVSRIQAGHPAVSLLQTGKNLGFSGGNNVGIREVAAKAGVSTATVSHVLNGTRGSTAPGSSRSRRPTAPSRP